jgi:hypothetical protein
MLWPGKKMLVMGGTHNLHDDEHLASCNCNDQGNI